jgi:hypothetical protein
VLHVLVDEPPCRQTKGKERQTMGNMIDSKRPKRTKCNYCFKERELVEGKPYCTICARDAVECRVCVRPLRAELIVDGVCRACRKKEQPNFRTGLGGAAETENVECATETTHCSQWLARVSLLDSASGRDSERCLE